jgi:uncharacterized protein (DUF1684 family)
MRHSSIFIAFAAAVALASCGPPVQKIDRAYIDEIETAWTDREARLMADDGWLTLIGLTWLEPGPNLVGSSPDAAVVLPEDAAPAEVCVLELDDEGSVILGPSPSAELTVNGMPAEPRVLASDASGAPDQLRVGRLLFYLISRGDRVGVRVKDPEAATRTGFEGIEHFPIDPAYRITAILERYPEPRQVAIPTVIGEPSMMLAPGVLRFEVGGEEVSLEPYVAAPDDRDAFIVFRDATSGDTTYGAGRFLDAEIRDDTNDVVLDFNLAINPPCAFTPFATGPLPTPENTLLVPIKAGEKYSGPAH